MSKLLAVLGGLLLSIAGAAAIHAQATSDQPFLMQELGSGVWAAITNPTPRPGLARTADSSSVTTVWSSSTPRQTRGRLCLPKS
jgi:hypothetical protein